MNTAILLTAFGIILIIISFIIIRYAKGMIWRDTARLDGLEADSQHHKTRIILIEAELSKNRETAFKLSNPIKYKYGDVVYTIQDCSKYIEINACEVKGGAYSKNNIIYTIDNGWGIIKINACDIVENPIDCINENIAYNPDVIIKSLFRGIESRFMSPELSKIIAKQNQRK